MKPAAKRVYDLIRGLRDRGSISDTEMDELLDATSQAETEFCNTVLQKLKRERLIA